MVYIASIRLANRILVSEDKDHEVIDLSKKHCIPVFICPDGGYENGPFIDHLFKNPDRTLTIQGFKDFIGDLVPLLDMYRGVRNFTFAEFYIKVILEVDGKKCEEPIQNEVAVFLNPDTKKWEIKTLKPEAEIIRKLKPYQQKRITREEFLSMKELVIAS